MKNTLCFIFLLLPSFSFAQSKELLQRIAFSETIRRLDYEKKYDSIITLSKTIPQLNRPDFYSVNTPVSQAYLEKGNVPMGLNFMA